MTGNRRPSSLEDRGPIWRSREFWGSIALWALLSAAAIAGIYVWQLSDIAALDRNDPAERIEFVTQSLQAKHVAVLAGLGSATLGVLLLRFRKQLHDERESERTHEACERQLDQTERQLALRDEELRNAWSDAEQRRILDHWARAIDKLGDDSAVVRIAGLHLLEELGRLHEDKRQAIIDHICAYLRQHYEPFRPSQDEQGWPGVRGPLPDLFSPLSPSPNKAVREERQVRLEAQRILQRHLNRVEHAGEFWEHQRIVLAGAYLENIVFDDCELRRADFSGAVFADFAEFSHAVFPTGATFRGARFKSTANFIEAEFDCDTEYLSRRKPGQMEFSEQLCADFRDVIFCGDAEWSVTKFHADVSFDRARFARCGFSAASFDQAASFQHVRFDDMLFFDVRKCYRVDFGEATATTKCRHVLHAALTLTPGPKNSAHHRLNWSREIALREAISDHSDKPDS